MKNWLFSVMCLVVAMIVVGGATRLTNSGLSITEWLPIKGALPPLNEEQWLIAFEKYKQIPEFLAEHPDMELAQFKFIYFWEWTHRQLGRLIGLAFAVPFLFFAVKRRISGVQFWKLLAVLLLIGFQGAIGWWMVASGLTDDRTSVSQYRLATHLGMAFVILGLLYWFWRDQFPKSTAVNAGRFGKRTGILGLLVFIQIIAGAFVAGTDSGKTYNTGFPLMDGDIVPQGYGIMSPFWRNLFENPPAIQFNHRILAYIIFVFALWVFLSLRKADRRDKLVVLMFALVLWQVALGIWTLISVAPLCLSLLHQFSSILVFLSVVALARRSVR